MLGSYLLDADAVEPGARGAGARVPRLQAPWTDDAVRGKGVKALRCSRLEPAAVLDVRRRTADLARAARARPGAEARPASSVDAVYRDLELPLVPVLADVERAGVRVDTRSTGGAGVARSNATLARPDVAHPSRWPAASSTSNSPKQLGEVLFEKLNLPALKKTGDTRSASDRRRSARGARARARTAAARSSSGAALHEVEGHLHRRAAARWCIRRRAACTPRSTRPWRPPGA